MKKQILFLFVVLHQSIISCAAPSSRDLMTFLTSPEIGGREAGTPEAARVADTLAALLAHAGLKPAGSDGYFQPFLAEALRIDSANTRVRFYTKEGTTTVLEATLANGLFFFPRHGKTQTINAPVLFGGYGIIAPELGRKDYLAEDAQGMFLVLFLGAPPDSAFRQGSAGFRYSLSPVKIRIAQESRALGVFFVQAEGDTGRLQKEIQSKARDFDPKMLQLPGTQSFPALYLDTLIGGQLLQKQENGKNEWMVNLALGFTMLGPCTLRNVLGIVEGTRQDKAEELLLVGAHFDHLGRRGETYFPGADDNASGVIASLTIAEQIVAQPLERPVLFAFFDGEEKELLGSKWLANHSAFEREIVTMVNLDGLGRKSSGHAPIGSPMKSHDSELTAFYSSQAPWIEEELGRVTAGQSLKVGWEAHPVFHEFSDHAPFHSRGIPVIFFFGGTHEDYHRPTDIPEKVEWSVWERRVEFISRCVGEIGKRMEKPVFGGEKNRRLTK